MKEVKRLEEKMLLGFIKFYDLISVAIIGKYNPSLTENLFVVRRVPGIKKILYLDIG
jgi:hypothetical protein